MASSLRITLFVACCAPALAEGSRLTPVRLASPVLERTHGRDGGIATSPVLVYDNTHGGYYFSYTGAAVRDVDVVKELRFAEVASGYPYGAWLNGITYGLTRLDQGPSSLDVLTAWYDTVDLDGSPAGEPVNKDPARPSLLWEIELGPNPHFPGATGWMITADISGLPGGGVPIADQHLMYEQGHYARGGYPQQHHPDFAPLWETRTTVGWSSDSFFGDADHDGTHELSDRYYFGGPPFNANILLAFHACIPCDADCNGTVNPFDIAPFIAALTGGVGCSPCSADCNVDGTANQFDIGAFLTCLGV